jgi:hypothetical protein
LELEKEIDWFDQDNFHKGFTGIAEKPVAGCQSICDEGENQPRISRISLLTAIPNSWLAWLGRVRDPALHKLWFLSSFDFHRPANAGS